MYIAINKQGYISASQTPSSPYNPHNESLRKLAPTKSDLKELKQILSDLAIHTPIPKFSTLSEMDHWRYDQIFGTD